MNKETILVTGGLWYIWSHCVVVLLEAGYDVVIVDNLDNSSKWVLDGIEKITGSRPPFHQCDIRDEQKLSLVFSQHGIDAVIHFAAKKAVGESMEMPFEYYDNNVTGTQTLLKVMDKFSVRKIVFSSTCAVYSSKNQPPYKENMLIGPESVYGITKVICEEMIQWLVFANKLNACVLRYFNPIWNHESWLIGEEPRQKPLNIMPIVMEVLEGTRESLSVFWNNYNTKDGTCIRDYIHVMDLVEAHVKALQRLIKPLYVWDAFWWQSDQKFVYEIVNLGTGQWSTVLEVIEAVTAALDTPLPYKIVDRRLWDLPAVYGDCAKAKQLFWREGRRTMSQWIQEMRKYRKNKII